MEKKTKLLLRRLSVFLLCFLVIYLIVFVVGRSLFESKHPILIEIGAALILSIFIFAVKRNNNNIDTDNDNIDTDNDNIDTDDDDTHITIERDSVCMADDVESHTVKYAIAETTKFSDLFQDLIHQGYLPYVIGNDVVWALYCDGKDLLSWKTKDNKMYSRFPAEEPTILCFKHKDVVIRFKYYSSPLRRAEWIYKNFGGQKTCISKEGFQDEYESYNVSQITENEWRNSL